MAMFPDLVTWCGRQTASQQKDARFYRIRFRAAMRNPENVAGVQRVGGGNLESRLKTAYRQNNNRLLTELSTDMFNVEQNCFFLGKN
jgi:hypothetical protein